MSRRRLSPEEAQRLLRDRASLVAARRTTEVATKPFALFKRGGQIFGVRLEQMHYCWPSSQLIEVTGAPRFVVGAASSRGVLVTAIDLAELYQFPIRGLSDIRMIFVVEHKGRRIGIASESSLGVRDVPSASIRPAPKPAGALVECASWAQDTMLVVDVERLFLDARLTPQREAER